MVDQSKIVERNPLRRYRRARELSMAEMAALLKVSKEAVRRYEMFGMRPRPATIRRMAELLEIDAAKLRKQLDDWSAKLSREERDGSNT